jgi:hypothetical protein
VGKGQLLYGSDRPVIEPRDRGHHVGIDRAAAIALGLAAFEPEAVAA